MSQARRLRREPLAARLMRRADRNASPPAAQRAQFIGDGELCREAAERLMKLEGYFDAMRAMAWDSRENDE